MPCFTALNRDRHFPAAERGPVLLAAFFLLASTRFDDVSVLIRPVLPRGCVSGFAFESWEKGWGGGPDDVAKTHQFHLLTQIMPRRD